MFVIMTTREALQYISRQLQACYDEGEAGSMARWILENSRGNSGALMQQTIVTPEQEGKFEPIIKRLLAQEPLQYVLNESWFSGLKLYVDENVLIPRPETEELVEWIIADHQFRNDDFTILDIGTGSGCIPLALKKRFPKAGIWACDISKGALAVAKKNAEALHIPVKFLQLDFLDNKQWEQLPVFDIIVSNPPYIPVKDKTGMQRNVVAYEPATALFVPDDDALVFYKAIAAFGNTHLHKNGMTYCEIHEDLGEASSRIFSSAGYTAELKKDMQGKDRMIRAIPA